MKSIIATFTTAFSIWRLSNMLTAEEKQMPFIWRITRWAVLGAIAFATASAGLFYGCRYLKQTFELFF